MQARGSAHRDQARNPRRSDHRRFQFPLRVFARMRSAHERADLLPASGQARPPDGLSPQSAYHRCRPGTRMARPEARSPGCHGARSFGDHDASCMASADETSRLRLSRVTRRAPRTGPRAAFPTQHRPRWPYAIGIADVGRTASAATAARAPRADAVLALQRPSRACHRSRTTSSS